MVKWTKCFKQKGQFAKTKIEETEILNSLLPNKKLNL